MSAAGRVFFIGAGPGDPGLITVRGLRLLADADVVVYDRGVETLLRWARSDAERLLVGAPAERDTAQDAICLLLAEKAREGRTVARLKWGDAFVFDSGAKEALFLHEHGIPFEVVPGVPAAVGAAAYAGVPLTYPDGADAVLLLRGREDERDILPDIDWSAVARLDATLVCDASRLLAARILGTLVDRGLPPDRTAALISSGTRPTQRTTTGTVADLLALTSDASATDPGVLVIGDVVGLRAHLRWFDERPLFGKRIVVTRSHEQARPLVERLESLGAEAIEAPTFQTVPPEDPESIDRAVAAVSACAWVIFQSANAAARFLAAILRGPGDLRTLGGVSICAVGPSTADPLLAHGLKPDLVVPEADAERTGELIAARRAIADQRVLVVRPDHARDSLARDLTQRGALVTDLVVYRTTAAPTEAPATQALYRMLLDGRVDAVTFTSPTAVRRFASLIGLEEAPDLLGTTTVAAIGPVTAAAAAELGIRASVMAATYTVDGLVAALVAHFSGR